MANSPKKLTEKFDFPFTISHQDRIFLMGSCFTDSMDVLFRYSGFRVEKCGNGTVFHPNALAKYIVNCFDEEYEERLTNEGDVCLSFDFSSKVYGMESKSFIRHLKEIRKSSVASFCNSSVMFVTFGTAMGYTYASDNNIAANCHKIPGSFFKKSMHSIENMQTIWMDAIRFLQVINPNLKIVFTVSPVRHLKDGLIENSRSKSRLIALCDELAKIENCYYFPAYELVIDNLRDYHYFEEDTAHPNHKAIDYVWQSLSNSFFIDDTNQIIKEGHLLRQASRHEPLHPESTAAIEFGLETEQKIKSFLERNPNFQW